MITALNFNPETQTFKRTSLYATRAIALDRLTKRLRLAIAEQGHWIQVINPVGNEWTMLLLPDSLDINQLGLTPKALESLKEELS